MQAKSVCKVALDKIIRNSGPLIKLEGMRLCQQSRFMSAQTFCTAAHIAYGFTFRGDEAIFVYG